MRDARARTATRRASRAIHSRPVGHARVHRPHPAAGCRDVLFAASLDGGKSLLSPTRVSSAASRPDDAKKSPNGNDYFGMVTNYRGCFYLLWSDARAGLFQLRTAMLELAGNAASTP